MKISQSEASIQLILTNQKQDTGPRLVSGVGGVGDVVHGKQLGDGGGVSQPRYLQRNMSGKIYDHQYE